MTNNVSRDVRVLMVGKVGLTMRKMAATMTPQRMAVSFTDSLTDALDNYDGADFDVVVLGRSLKTAERGVLQRDFLAAKPAPAVVHSMGPYGELVGAQVAQAGIESGVRTGRGAVRVTGRDVDIDLDGEAEVAISVFRHTFSLVKRPVITARLTAGRHQLRVTRRQRGWGRWVFLQVAVDGEWQAIARC